MIAIVGTESLLGREVRDVLSEGVKLPLRLIASSTGGVFTNLDEQADILDELNADSLADVIAVVLAGTPASCRKALRLVRESGQKTAIIDLTGTLEDQPEGRLIAPLAEISGTSPSGIVLCAHPAATALAILLPALHRHSNIKRTVVTAMEPVSERGQRGLDELQQQSASLLSFREMPKDVFDLQIAYNLVPRYGEEAVINLEDIEQTIDRHLASLLANLDLPGLGMPSLRLIQAPVFHGYSFQLWVEFENSIDAAHLLNEIEAPLISVRREGEEVPTNVDAAGQSGLIVGAVEADRNAPNAIWMWVNADAFRLSAENCLRIFQN
jgi:aspartate-semialdehyde dehydrogenase